MLEILQNFISILTGDATLTGIVPATNIMTGPVDIVTETQSGLIQPQVNISVESEVSRSVPLNTRDTTIKLDIWSRNSQLETENIYERIITLLNYVSGDKSGAHFFWQRLGSAIDQFETDRRIWHKSISFAVWSIK